MAAVLSVRQKEAVNGLAKACVGCLGRGNALGGPAEAERILSSRTRDYEGNLVERVGEINADLVIGAWPQEGEAAVAEVTDFLEGDARAAVISPRLHLRRRTAEASRSTQEEWNKVVSAASLNASKALAGALRGGHSGRSPRWRPGHHFSWPEKSERLVLATLGLLATPSWTEAALRRWVGAAFRRPLFASFQEIFPLIERARAVDPDPQVIDEMVTFVLLLPLASTSLRARVSSEISCSDVSLSEGEPRSLRPPGGPRWQP